MTIKIIFFGTPAFSEHCLKALCADGTYEVTLVVTNPDRPSGRGQKISESPVKKFALSQKIPVITPDSIKKDISDFIEEAKQYGPFDVGVVVAFGQILPEKVLNLPRNGCINVHASLLPKWRGAAPIQRSIMEGDTKTGVGLMQMETGLDTGPVYSESKCLISDTTTASILHDQLADLGSQLLTSDLKLIVEKKLKAVPQSENAVTYAKKITNEESFIDWNQPSKKILRHIHGLSSFPGAFTIINDSRIKIFEVSIIEHSSNPDKLAGEILQASGNDLTVSTKDGVIAIISLQSEGKKRLPVKEFLAGTKLTPGDRFARRV